MNTVLFYIIIFLTNVIQGITGFAGTILAMPPSLILVGYDVAKPILNVLGILAGVYVFVTQWKHVDWKQLKKVVIVMAIGIFGGFFLKNALAGYDAVLYKFLGIFVIFLAIHGFYSIYGQRQRDTKEKSSWKSMLLLIGAGIVHGMFVSGGPLLIGYLSNEIKEKTSFRATISTVWIILNSMILVQDICAGMWNAGLVMTQCISIPFLIAGMAAGSVLVKRMSQEIFMKLTYILLFISGILPHSYTLPIAPASDCAQS